MTSTHDQTEPVDRELYNEVFAGRAELRDQLAAVRAVVNRGQPDWGEFYRSIYDASQLIYALLALPETRPGCSEAPHVEALSEQLCAILDALKAERPEQYKAEDGDGGRS